MFARRLSFVATILVAGGALAGPINPPAGPIAPTNKTLDEVEPRIPLSQETTPGDADSMFRIEEPGSYYLVDDIDIEAGKYGVIIVSDGVTLDLKGFTISATGSSLDGIRIGSPNVRVHNGAIIGVEGGGVWSFGGRTILDRVRVRSCGSWGIYCFGPESVVRGCSASNCGGIEADTGGIYVLQRGSIIESSTADNNMAEGMYAVEASRILDSTSHSNTGIGIHTEDSCVISGCISFNNGDVGIQVGESSTAIGCAASDNQSTGISAGSRSVLETCTSSGNLLSGFRLGRACIVRNCDGSSNTEDGIVTPLATNNANSTIVDSVFSDNGAFGIRVGNGSVVRGCVVAQNGSAGIDANTGVAIEGCNVRQNGTDGIVVVGDCRVSNNTCDNNGASVANGAAIRTTSTDNRIDGNHMTDNDIGVSSSGDNVIFGNSASNHPGGSFNVQASDLIGPTISGSGVIGSTNPWANLVY